MSEKPAPADEVVARHFGGAVSEPLALNALIRAKWAIALGNPEHRLAIAKLLSLDERSLDPEQPPVTAKIGAAGLTSAEILILLAKGFFGGAGAGLGKLTVEGVREVWRRYLSKPLQDPRTQSIGSERKDQGASE